MRKRATLRKVADRVLLIVVLTLAVFLLSNCQREPEIQGSVSVSAEGGQKYRIKGIEVIAISEEGVEAFLNNKKAALREAYGKFSESKRAEVKPFEDAYKETKIAYDTITKNHSELQNKMEELELEYNPHTAELDSNPALLSLPWNQTPEQKAYLAQQRRLRQQLDKLRRQLEQLELQKQTITQRLELKRKELSEKQSSIAKEVNPGEFAFKNKEIIFKDLVGLPDGIAKTTTDGNGEFTIKLPRTKRVALAAHTPAPAISSASGLTQSSELVWLVWVEIDGTETKRVELNEQNTLSSWQYGANSVISIQSLAESLPAPFRAEQSYGSSSPASDADEITQRRYEECIRQRNAAGLDTSPCAEWAKER